MTYWSWDRWEAEIDWMALQGINLPLAFSGKPTSTSSSCPESYVYPWGETTGCPAIALVQSLSEPGDAKPDSLGAL